MCMTQSTFSSTDVKEGSLFLALLCFALLHWNRRTHGVRKKIHIIALGVCYIAAHNTKLKNEYYFNREAKGRYFLAFVKSAFASFPFHSLFSASSSLCSFSFNVLVFFCILSLHFRVSQTLPHGMIWLITLQRVYFQAMSMCAFVRSLYVYMCAWNAWRKVNRRICTHHGPRGGNAIYTGNHKPNRRERDRAYEEQKQERLNENKIK